MSLCPTTRKKRWATCPEVQAVGRGDRRPVWRKRPYPHPSLGHRGPGARDGGRPGRGAGAPGARGRAAARNPGRLLSPITEKLVPRRGGAGRLPGREVRPGTCGSEKAPGLPCGAADEVGEDRTIRRMPPAHGCGAIRAARQKGLGDQRDKSAVHIDFTFGEGTYYLCVE